MTNFQEDFYTSSTDYRSGSPHLTFLGLYDRLSDLVRGEIARLADAGLPLTALELGAGHGAFTEVALASGCQVTAVEMSLASTEVLGRRFGHNAGFRAIYDPVGDLGDIDGSFSLIVAAAVLHHIPDYLAAVERLLGHLAPGGSLIALQDPLWYPRAAKSALLLNQLGFALWRVRQGNLRRGLRVRLHRSLKGYDEDSPGDMVEYHVVRQGVDEEAIRTALEGRFAEVTIVPYWSNQSAVAQWAGTRLGLENTFGVTARDYGRSRVA